MSIIQISRIQVRTGNIADLPQLAEGEFGWAVDTKQLFIGNNPNTIGPLPDNTEIMTQYNTLGAAGNNMDVQYNNNGAFAGSDSFTWDNANSVLNIVGTVQSDMYLSESTITTSYTLPLGYNGMTPGPVTLDTGVTITVPAGTRWTVV